MKTVLLIIPITVLSVIGLFFLFDYPKSSSLFPEGISLTYMSDDDFEVLLKQDFMQGVTIKKITDEDLKSVPKIKELIAEAQRNEFPLNQEGRILSDFDTLKKYHQYYAEILSKKYSKDPKEFIKILPASPSDLEVSPQAYNYDFDGEFF